MYRGLAVGERSIVVNDHEAARGDDALNREIAGEWGIASADPDTEVQEVYLKGT